MEKQATANAAPRRWPPALLRVVESPRGLTGVELPPAASEPMSYDAAMRVWRSRLGAGVRVRVMDESAWHACLARYVRAAADNPIAASGRGRRAGDLAPWVFPALDSVFLGGTR